MKQARILLVVAAAVAAIGIIVSTNAGSLATRWQPLGEGAWGGTIDVDLAHAYGELGFMTVALGLILATIAAWHWLKLQQNMIHPLSTTDQSAV